MAGVVEVYVNPATEEAYVAYDPTHCRLRNPERAIERAGYPAGTVRAREV